MTLNLAIFAAFRREARVLVKDNENYKLANAILSHHQPKNYKPLSPAKFGLKQWGTKGLTLTLSTAVTSVALTNIIIYYDWVTAVSCLITIIIAVIFGLMNMSSEEIYWTEDYLRYAYAEQKAQEDKNKSCQSQLTISSTETSKNK